MPPLWWSVLVAVVLGGLLWASQLSSEPRQAEQSSAAISAGVTSLPIHWLAPDGVYAMTLLLTTNTVDNQPAQQQKLILISRFTPDFKGLMAVVPEGERWLRREQDIYRLLPNSEEPNLVKIDGAAEGSFIDSALSVSDFFFGFGWENMAPDHSDPTRKVVYTDPNNHAPYHRLDVETNEKGCLMSLVTQDELGMPQLKLTMLSFEDLPNLCLPQHVVVENISTGLTTDVVVEKWSTQAFPPFVFTPQTLKSFAIEE